MPDIPKLIPATYIRAEGLQDWWLPIRVIQHPVIKPLGITRAGVETTPAPWNTNRESTSWHTLILVLDGQFRCDSNTGSTVAKPGDLIVLPAGVLRQCTLISDAMKIAVFWLSRIPVWKRFESEAPIVAASSCGEPVRRLLMLMHEESLLAGHEEDDVVRNLSQAMAGYLHRLAAEAGGPAPSRQRQAVTTLWREIHAEPSLPWDADELAARINVSTTHLRRLCKQFHGCTPGQMIARIRMDIASELLIRGEETMDEVADRVGYANAYSFSRAFLSTTGERPGAYRSRLHS